MRPKTTAPSGDFDILWLFGISRPEIKLEARVFLGTGLAPRALGGAHASHDPSTASAPPIRPCARTMRNKPRSHVALALCLDPSTARHP